MKSRHVGSSPRRTRSTTRLPPAAPRRQPADQIPQRRQGVVVLVLRRLGTAVGRRVRITVKLRFVQQRGHASRRILSPPVSMRPETQSIPGRSSLLPVSRPCCGRTLVACANSARWKRAATKGPSGRHSEGGPRSAPANGVGGETSNVELGVARVGMLPISFQGDGRFALWFGRARGDRARLKGAFAFVVVAAERLDIGRASGRRVFLLLHDIAPFCRTVRRRSAKHCSRHHSWKAYSPGLGNWNWCKTKCNCSTCNLPRNRTG